MIRRCYCKGYIIIVTKLVILLGMTNQIIGEKINTGQSQNGVFHYHDLNKSHLFYGSKILPEGGEITAYLLFNDTVDVMFFVEDNNTPISLKITPCASAVESMVTYKSISITDSNDYDDEDLFKDQLEPVTPKPTISTGTLVDYFVGSTTRIFERNSNSSGIYTVSIRPTESDTYVKFLLTLKYQTNFYPSLPRNSTISSDRVRRKSFTILWNPSPDETPYDNVITYCVSISYKRRYDNYCSLMSYMFGDKLPEPQSGFLFPWDKEVMRVLRNKARPVQPVNPKDIHYNCVGRKTKYIYTQAIPGRTYYVNVYAINKITNRTSSYKTIEVTTKSPKKQKVHKLRDGKLQEVVFTKSNLRREFKYDLKNTSNLFLAVHSCTGKVTIQVTRGKTKGMTLLNKKVKMSSNLDLQNLEADTYYITLKISRRNGIPKDQNKVVRLVVSKKQSKLRYPSLPRKSDVFLVENSTTSNTLTIGWRGTNSRQKFCIYQKEILHSVRRKKRRNYNQCNVTPIEDSKKVKCIRVRHEKSNMVLNHQIRNLKSNTNYQFDVVIQLAKGYSLLYNSLQAKTKLK